MQLSQTVKTTGKNQKSIVSEVLDQDKKYEKKEDVR